MTAQCKLRTSSSTSIVCAQVYAANSGRTVSFMASMVRYQFGDVCFAAPPPPPGAFAPPPLPFPHFPWEAPPPPVMWPPTEIFPALVYAPASHAAVSSEGSPPRLLRRTVRLSRRLAHKRKLLLP
ncbi:hypothetical protein WJX81_000164 [Elliptochloris bilobata]|uniref:Uncharacterized protein n=1 Tax=Elliptochloris bilobata TaxID=381761 RepID=A0AAW1RRK3_9CHLO